MEPIQLDRDSDRVSLSLLRLGAAAGRGGW